MRLPRAIIHADANPNPSYRHMVIQAYGFTREAILRVIAHKLYESRGIYGSPEDDWLQAEHIYTNARITSNGERICSFFVCGKRKVEVRFGPDRPNERD